MARQTDGEKDKQINGQTYIWTDGQMGRRRIEKTDGQENRPTNKPMGHCR